MNKRWGFWTFWVSINAIAAFAWGFLISDNLWSFIGGMLVGISCFIVFYTLLDDFARKNGWHKFIAALQKGVYIKAGLQVLNLAVIIPISPLVSPEVLAGMGGLSVTESVLDMNQPFLLSFITTLITGALLSLLVGVISLIVLFISDSKRTDAITANDVL